MVRSAGGRSAVCVLVACMAFSVVSTFADVDGTSPVGLSLIYQDLEAGRLSTSQALILRATALLCPAQLPPRYEQRSGPIEPCATQVLNEIRASGLRSVPGAPVELSSFLQRPSGLDEQSESQHFVIHYTLDSPNRPGLGSVPDFLRAAIDACEAAWVYHAREGWPPPLADGQQGGSDRIDVYVLDLGWGVYGYALGEDLPAAQGKAGFIVIDNDFAGAETAAQGGALLSVTLAHEYHHLVQLGYGYAPEANWFMEQTATMVEGLVCPGIQDRYRYLPYFTATPYRPLDLSNGSFEYGAWLWPQYLYERWGTDLLTTAWEQWSGGGTTMLQALDAALGIADPALQQAADAEGSALDTAYRDWTTWNTFLGDFNDGNHYQHGSEYPARVTPEAVITSYPVQSLRPEATRQPGRFGASYVELRPSGTSADNRLGLGVSACSSALRGVLVTWPIADAAPVVQSAILGGSEIALSVPHWDETGRAYLIIVNGSQANSGCDYSVTATTRFATADVEDGSSSVGSLPRLANAPNPFEPYTVIRYELPSDAPITLRIFDSQGRWLETLYEGGGTAGSHALRWRGPSVGQQGGIFFCEIRSPFGSQRIQLIHVR